MTGPRWRSLLAALCLGLLAGTAGAQESAAKTEKPDLTRQPTLFVVGYAHLDTQWRWEYPQVIREYLPSTLHDNFTLFEKYPHYIFNFSGANRYRLMKEYYPADYARMKQYIAAGRWFPAGSSMEESDVNSPSAESIFRQVLYGNRYFRREFGRSSAEYMLPDCFGFPASLPSILAHSGIKGFSTQKLTWGSSAPGGGPDSPERTPEGTPFNVGVWEGPDGRSVIAALNPGSYSADITTDLTKPLPAEEAPNPQRALQRFQGDWAARVQHNGEATGLWTDYHYYGTGDIGGSPREPAVKLLEAILTKGEAALPQPRRPGQAAADVPSSAPVKVGDGPVHVASSTAEQMFLDIPQANLARLPHYKGEMELTNHSAGSLSSQAYKKRWNRKNELLADAAEKASLAAAWLGGPAYPIERLNNAWTLVMGGQFHDIAAGTATPKAYEYSWNDDTIAANQFAEVLTTATRSVAQALDTQVTGIPVVVFNPLNVAREDVVEASLPMVADSGAARVSDAQGKEVPSQLVKEGNTAKVLFLAKVPSVGYAVYSVAPGNAAGSATSQVRASKTSLENQRYRITINGDGDVAGIFDKVVNKELLSAPARLAFQTEKPHDWPAWNMDWADQQKPPRSYVSGPATIRVVEQGPVRAAVEISRQSEGSTFVQTIRLSAGDAGNRVEFANTIDWHTEAAALKATFPLTVSNENATYNWDVGTIERASNHEKMFEVPSHQWFDLTDKSGAYGVTVLSDCKYGSDKPDDKTLRLTLIYTPGLGDGNGRAYNDQTSQDFGHHEFVYGLAGHAGSWQQAGADWQGYRLNQPLIAFTTAKHAGSLGRSVSLLKLSNNRVRALAMKRAEDSDEIVVRLVELDGKPASTVRIGFAASVTAAREVNGQEDPLGPAKVQNGEVIADFTPFQLHTFAVKMAPATNKVAAIESHPVPLAYDEVVATLPGTKSATDFDSAGRSLPAEMLPHELVYDGVRFTLKPEAVIARGQSLTLPPGRFDSVYVLAAADGDQDGAFTVGDHSETLRIQDYSGYIGQWNNRIWRKTEQPVPARPGSPVPAANAPPRVRTVLEYAGLNPGYLKTAPLAWYASHRHDAQGNDEPYAYSYLFAYRVPLPANAKTLTLPNNPKIRIMAVSVASDGADVKPAQPLWDVLGH